MTPDKNDRESPRDTTDGGTEDKSTQENGDWITELELEEISKKWFGSRSQGGESEH